VKSSLTYRVVHFRHSRGPCSRLSHCVFHRLANIPLRTHIIHCLPMYRTYMPSSRSILSTPVRHPSQVRCRLYQLFWVTTRSEIGERRSSPSILRLQSSLLQQRLRINWLPITITCSARISLPLLEPG
jgi:hypothetical protein